MISAGVELHQQHATWQSKKEQEKISSQKVTCRTAIVRGNLGSPRDNTLTLPRNHTLTSPRPVIPSPYLDFSAYAVIPSLHLDFDLSLLYFINLYKWTTKRVLPKDYL